MSRNSTPKKRAFLAAYAATGCITLAAKAAGIDRTLHYRWLERDADYPERFADAQNQAVDTLETEARRRAVEGVRRLKFHNGQPVIDPATGQPYVEMDYSDVLLIFLLKAARPEKYRERFDSRVSGSIEQRDRVRIAEHSDWYGNAERLEAAQPATVQQKLDDIDNDSEFQEFARLRAMRGQDNGRADP